MIMCKRILRNASLYLLASANVIYAMKHGFDWLTWVAIGLTVIVLIGDIAEGFKNGKRK